MAFGKMSKFAAVLAMAFGFGAPALADGHTPAGDAAAGERVFRQCMACHVVQEGQNRVGPSLYNVYGRTAGSIENYRYSNAMKDSGLVWTAETLDPYLENPRAYVKGTRMAYAGLRNPKQREDVIAYLFSVSPDAPTAAAEEEATEEEAPAEADAPAEEEGAEETDGEETPGDNG